MIVKQDCELRSRYRKARFDGFPKDVHRHLMEEKLGRKLNKSEVVHHKDGNCLNNDINNLELLTRSEHARLHEHAGDYNARHSGEARAKLRKSMANYWKDHVNTRSKKVAMCSKDGKILQLFDSVYRVKDAGFDSKHVSACCSGKRRTHKGFCWKFVDFGG